MRELEMGTTENRQLIAYIVLKSEEPFQERELRSFLKTKLPLYMLPAAFVILDKLPLTANGKIDRKALPPPDLNLIGEMAPTLTPTTSLESALKEIWMQLLGRKHIGIHDRFFELGGHSLLATQLISRIRDRFGVELPLRSIFETPTIAELAEKIESLSPSQRREEIEI
uniref:Phosphopantetheine-binding protein n=1 Tax=Desertifilum tharense IPPAS B-1220 TaxID=1781255 RepID=A0ACD5GZX8_9CYAN